MNKVEQPTCDSNPAGFRANHQFSRESVPCPTPVAPLGVFLLRLMDEQVPRVQHRVRGNCMEKKEINLISTLNNVSNGSQLNKATHILQKNIVKASSKAYRIKTIVKNKPLTWWNPQLEIRKKQLNALRRKMQKSEGVEKENYTSVYSKTRATYKKEILHAKRQAWRKFCSESGTPFGKPFKTTVNTSLPPSEIFKAIDVSGSGNSNAIAKKLLEKIYPYSPQETPSLPETYSFAKDPSFTKEEIKRVIQTLPKGKAPGFDGIDNQVVHIINDYFPDIFHKLFNKFIALSDTAFRRLPALNPTDLVVSYFFLSCLPDIGSLREL
ncbi:putative RNA-directed DNA polymerase from transposon X-element [Caerostris darwini]|uniref:RNA-directed DNA polymerase from transposon X-element n=1 Tax=Caerostris darwini TaxID=1538125 RepID=A0AAV4UI36_9ARAC|nr:putative RNA-directed DNA polymerase from transposon X-element [Caerostris darwini]